MATITETEYQEAVDSYMGWCTNCEGFTREGTDPDAENNFCPECDRYDVYGAEIALVMMLFEFSEE